MLCSFDALAQKDIADLPSSVGELIQNPGGEVVKAKEPKLLTDLDRNIRLLSEDNGLISNRLERILEDELGNLWFITRQGISKYNGTEFVQYLTEFEFKSGTVDKSGNLWFGTYKQGVIKYDGLNFYLFDEKFGFPSTNIRAIKPGYDKGVIVMHDQGISWTTENGFKHSPILKNDLRILPNDLICVDSNFMVIVSEGIGFMKFENDEVQYYQTNEEITDAPRLDKMINVMDITLDHEDVWVATRHNGTLKIPLEEFMGDEFPSTVESYAKGNSKRAFKVDDKIWTLTAQGPMLIGDGIIDQIESRKDFNVGALSDVYVDKSGLVWFASRFGVLIYDDGPFDYFRHQDEVDQPYSQLKCFENTMYFAKGRTVYKSEPGLVNVKKYFAGRRGGVRDIEIGEYGEPWFGFFGDGCFIGESIQGVGEDFKIGKHELKSETDFAVVKSELGDLLHLVFYPQLDSATFTNKFVSALQLHQGDMYLGAHGLFRFTDDSNFVYYWKQGLEEPECNALSVAQNKLWVGTQNGLFKLDGQKFHKIDAFEDEAILRLYTDSRERLWVSVGLKRLVVYDTKLDSITATYSKENGLNNLNIRSIIEDKKRQIWLGTNKGVYRILTDCEKNQQCIKHFSRTDGFLSLNCIDNAVSLDQEGNIWWAADDRLIKYNHKDDFEEKFVPRTYIKQVHLSTTSKNWQEFKRIDEEVQIDSLIRWANIPHFVSLPYEQNSLSFSYASIDWRNIDRLQYQFKLEGSDQQWSELTDNTTITLSQLKPGLYNFFVRATNDNGYSFGEPTSFRFEIRKPFWQKLWFYVLLILLVSVIIFLIIKSRERTLRERQIYLEETVANRTNELKTEKELVELQKKEIEKKNTNITESINYAKRIQEAILPGEVLVQKYLPQSFVFYKPKDIVSGDFYWIFDAGDRVLFSAVDCTGHGVPGALMSIVGHSMLEKVVKEYGLLKPSLILNALSKEVARTLSTGVEEQKHTDIKDGMDLAICSVYKNKLKAEFAGAYNPLYIIRDEEVLEIKSDRLQIGKLNYTKGESFSNKEIELQSGDTLYIFSDGFADQKGGPKRKKFYYQPFREFLLKIHKLPMHEQKNKLEEHILAWKGDLEQTDDICIIGVKV
ncbi:MAG: SpoIIE family protein phosphatase [Flavobacteriales bacterium]|nr:SpoIIE family protein phosphatase [Flavobacteriales bacterium]